MFCKLARRAWHGRSNQASLHAGGQATSDAEDSDQEGDQVWQGITPPDEAGPSRSSPTTNGSAAAHAISLAAGEGASCALAASEPSFAKLPAANGGSRGDLSGPSAADIKVKHASSRANGRAQGTQPARKKIRLPTLAEQPALEAQHQEDTGRSASAMPASRKHPAVQVVVQQDKQSSDKLHLRDSMQHWVEPKVCPAKAQYQA